MNIKEMENRTGLERANIYFYEKEGLIKPARLENGYRDYSDEDYKLLMKIKLLRSLHISLDDIRALIAGETSLCETMGRQIHQLELEEEKAIYARTLCENIRDEEISFVRLDAEKHLNGVPKIPKAEENPYFSMPIEVYPQTLFPWKRFFARIFDLTLYDVLGKIFFFAVFETSISNPTIVEEYLLFFITGFGFLLLFEPLFLHFFGTTPGKFIWGLSVKTSEGKNLSFRNAFQRTLILLRRGLGFYIPIYRWYRQYRCYQICSDHRLQDWEVDDPVQYTAKDNSAKRPILFAILLIFLNILPFAAARFEVLPPNRGDLIIEELVENYHYYAKRYNYDYDGATLMPDGQWHVEEDPYTIHLSDYDPYPTYEYVTDGKGHVREVSFTMEITGKDIMIAYPDDQITLLTLAMAGSTPVASPFSSFERDIILTIGTRPFEDFSLFTSGVYVESTCEYEGYYEPYGNTLLIRKEPSEDSYFRLTFCCRK